MWLVKHDTVFYCYQTQQHADNKFIRLPPPLNWMGQIVLRLSNTKKSFYIYWIKWDHISTIIFHDSLAAIFCSYYMQTDCGIHNELSVTCTYIWQKTYQSYLIVKPIPSPSPPGVINGAVCNYKRKGALHAFISDLYYKVFTLSLLTF